MQCTAANGLRHNVPRSIGFVEIHTLEGIAGDLGPDAVFLHRDLVHLDIVDLELAGLWFTQKSMS